MLRPLKHLIFQLCGDLLSMCMRNIFEGEKEDTYSKQTKNKSNKKNIKREKRLNQHMIVFHVFNRFPFIEKKIRVYSYSMLYSIYPNIYCVSIILFMYLILICEFVIMVATIWDLFIRIMM